MTDQNCLFCKIFKGEIPAEKVYEDDTVMAFKDINPIAKIHILFIHKNHTHNVNEISEKHPEQLQQIFRAISNYTKNEKLAEQGFRIITNQGEKAGQSVFHTHFHLLAGERLPWRR